LAPGKQNIDISADMSRVLAGRTGRAAIALSEVVGGEGQTATSGGPRARFVLETFWSRGLPGEHVVLNRRADRRLRFYVPEEHSSRSNGCRRRKKNLEQADNSRVGLRLATRNCRHSGGMSRWDGDLTRYASGLVGRPKGRIPVRRTKAFWSILGGRRDVLCERPAPRIIAPI